MNHSIVLSFVFVTAATLQVAEACDGCATLMAIPAGDAAGKTSVGLYNEYSEIDAPPSGGHSYSEYNLQLALRHPLGKRWDVSASLPYLDKELDGDSEHGLGDAAVSLVYRALPALTEKDGSQVDIYIGATLPTGDTDPLEEERDVYLENQEHSEHGHDDHHAHAHGHYHSLGSGSVDALLGLRGACRKGKIQSVADAQYRLTTEGDYDFEYGDAINARLGISYSVIQNEMHALGIGVDGTFNWRDENAIVGDAQEGSDSTTAYIGPSIAYDRPSFQASFALDLPVEGEDEGLNGASDQRLRLALLARF